MFHTFHKASQKPTKVLRRRAAPGCQACQQKRIGCSRDRPQCKECAHSKTTCFYTTSSSRHAFRLQTPNKTKSHSALLEYDLGDGSLSPGSTSDSIDSGISMESCSTLNPGIGLFDASPTTSFMDDNFFFMDNMKMQDDDTLWLDMSALGEASPMLPEMPPSSPECQAVQSCSTGLSAAPSLIQMYPTDAVGPNCYHGEKIDQLLCEVMGRQWPAVASTGPASLTDALSVLRDALNQLDILSKCLMCMSSCKSMSLVLVITKAVFGHITALVYCPSTFDEVSMQLGSYSADSAEECHFVYAQIMRRYVVKFADVADSFARDAHRAGWLAHVLPLQGVAAEARSLAHSDFDSM